MNLVRRRQRGFTLMELMVTIGIVGVLFGLGVPMFRQSIDFVSAKTVAVELAGDLRMARSSAVKRNTTVSVLPMTGGWSAGWQVKTAAGDLLSQYAVTRAGVTIAAPANGVQFASNGRIANTDTATSDMKWTVSTATSSGTRCVRTGVTGAASITLGACS